jgi:hypothetical protein
MKKSYLSLLIAFMFSSFAISQTYRATVASGNWNNTATWQGGVLPGSGETPVITAGHTVTYNISSGAFAGIIINGHLNLDQSGTHTLQSTKNIEVYGKLTMQATSFTDYQLIQFINIDEDDFVGGGENIVATDVGLWVMDTGRLHLDGSAGYALGKTPWVNASGSISTSQNTVGTAFTPLNWKSGDVIAIAPTQAPSVGDDYFLGFDNASLTAHVTSASLQLSSATVYPHPQVNSQWTAEIMNLSRPVRIEGTATGRSHIFIRSSKPHFISNAEFRYLGPRKDINNDGHKELVPGRYGLHFHHCEEGTRGTVVQNCVMRQVYNHAYVPHGSHGMVFRKNIAYDVTETPFWWDEGHVSHDIMWDSNLVALAKFVPHAISAPLPNGSPSFAVSAFQLGMGDGDTANNNIAIATTGRYEVMGAYNWEADNEGVWEFKNNLAHNCEGALRVWQNTAKSHVIENFVAYHNGEGIFHGAYVNNYRYVGGTLYGSSFIAHAGCDHSGRMRIENMTINAAGLPYGIQMIESPVSSALPMLVRNCTITGYTIAALTDSSDDETHAADIIQTNGTFIVDPAAGSGEVLRIQPVSGQPVQKTTLGTVNIAKFAPTIWGDGTGLKGEYFNNTDFTDPAFTRTDHYVNVPEWTIGIEHYALENDLTYSVRWTGQVQPQYTTNYKFRLGSGGGHRLWVNDSLIIDSWEDHYPGEFESGYIALTAGEKYNIKLEYFNEDERSGINLFWECDSLESFSPGGEYIPQSQLWPTMGSSLRVMKPATKTVAAATAVRDLIVPTFVKNSIVVQSPKEAAYVVYDLGGRLVNAGKLRQGINYIPVSGASNGMLLLKVDNRLFKVIKH